MKIIGRNTEIKKLEEIYRSNEAELVAIYGRRRVGKTFLIREFIKQQKCMEFYTTGIYKGNKQTQLDRFTKEVSQVFHQGAPLKSYDSWMDGFDGLNEAINKTDAQEKIIIFFDELPWMDTHKSGLIKAIDYFWNRYWSQDKRIKFILCGSSASWLIKKIINNKGGLHNRVTHRMRLTPFDLKTTQEYITSIGLPYNQKQILKLYMVTGGVAFYIKKFKKSLSLDQNINQLFFSADGEFFEEFEQVFSSLFKHSTQYKLLIEVIANKREGMTRKEIENKLNEKDKGGQLTTRLEDLELSGFIKSYLPYGGTRKGLHYRLSDEYCYFYLKWIKPIKHALKHEEDINYWQGKLGTPEYYSWLGYAFESACFKHIKQIKKSIGIAEHVLFSSWQKKGSTSQDGAQIDMLFDRDDDAISLCEIKYKDKTFSIDKGYAAVLSRKKDVFVKASKTDKQIFMTMICANGLADNLYSQSLISSVVTLENLFE